MSQTDHYYRPVLSVTAIFGDAADDPVWQSPMRVRIYLPTSLTDLSNLETGAIRNAPEPIVQIAKMHTNTAYSPGIHDQALSKVIVDNPATTGEYDAIADEFRRAMKHHLRSIASDTRDTIRFPNFAELVAKARAAESFSDAVFTPTKDTVEENLHTTATRTLVSGARWALSGGWDPVSGYKFAANSWALQDTFRKSYRDAPGNNPQEKLTKALVDSVVQPVIDRAGALKNLDENNRENSKGAAKNYAHKNELHHYSDNQARRPQLITVEPDLSEVQRLTQDDYCRVGSGTVNGKQKLINFDPCNHNYYFALHTEGDAGDAGYDGIVTPNSIKNGLYQELIVYRGLELDTSDLAYAQRAAWRDIYGEPHDQIEEGRIAPEDFEFESRENGLGVMEPGIYGDPDEMEPKFKIRTLDGDGNRQINNRNQAFKIVCYPHPKLNFSISIHPELEPDAEGITAKLRDPDVRASLLAEAAAIVEPDFPDIADEISANCEWTQRAYNCMKRNGDSPTKYAARQIGDLNDKMKLEVRNQGIHPEYWDLDLKGPSLG